MSLKSNKFLLTKFLLAIWIGISIPFLQVDLVQASRYTCESITIDKNNPIITRKFTESKIKKAIERQQKEYNLTENKAKGIVGEQVARMVIEKELNTNGQSVVSIETMFRNQGCNVIEYLRNRADQGIDDIFVVIRSDGWIDKRYNPIFHEAKFNDGCKVQLNTTKTLCQQLSFQWLNGNLGYAKQRTGAAICFNDHNEVIIRSCTECRNKFQENIEWLAEMLKNGYFYRTASLLCANGKFSVYNVDSSM